MKKLKFLLAAMLLGCSTMSFAQFMNGGGGSSFSPSSDVDTWKGLRFSYDRTFVNQDWDDADDADMNGFSIGYVHSFKIAKKLPIFFETGLGFNFARHSEDYSEDSGDPDDPYYYSWEEKETTTAMGLTIPLNVVYGVKINNTLAIKPYTGFYLRINVSAKDKYEYSDTEGDSFDESVNMFDEKEISEILEISEKEAEKLTWNRCQFGWQIGATLDINKFNVGIGYALDFNEIAEKTKTSKFAVNLGYNF